MAFDTHNVVLVSKLDEETSLSQYPKDSIGSKTVFRQMDPAATVHTILTAKENNTKFFIVTGISVMSDASPAVFVGAVPTATGDPATDLNHQILNFNMTGNVQYRIDFPGGIAIPGGMFINAKTGSAAGLRTVLTGYQV